MRAWWLGAAWLVGCPAGSGGDPPEVTCDAVCPEGTRLAAWEQVVVGQGFVVVGERCEAACEPITHCRPPTIPVLGEDSWACVALDGWSEFTPDAEVDFSWADVWVAP